MEMNSQRHPGQLSGAHKASPSFKGTKNRWLGWAAMGAAALVLVIVVIVGLAIFVKPAQTGQAAVKTNQYQAVFLTNGQVYFGKIKSITDDNLTLNDIYYLQVQQSVQPDAQKKADATDQQQLSLAKLGSELHGPEDTMYLSRDQILFWENLKEDSKVVQAIKNNGK